MSEAIGIVISAVITVIGMLAMFFLTKLSERRQRKDAFNERLFFDVYPRRLGVYEEAIKGLLAMTISEKDIIMDITGLDMSKAIIEKIHVLDILIVRLSLFGSPNSLEAVKKFRGFLFQMQDSCLSQPLSRERGMEAALNVSKMADIILVAFTAAVSEEAGNNFIENKITDITEWIKKRKKEDQGIK